MKNKFSNILFYLKKRELPEILSLVLTFLTTILVLILSFFVVNFFLPHPRIEIQVVGPSKAKVGELLTYQVSLKNTGNVILEEPELILNLSPNFVSQESEELIIKKSSEIFPDGKIYPKQTVKYELKARLFGKENDKGEIQAWLNYKVKKGKKIYVSKTVNVITQISEVPIQLVLDLPNKIAILPQQQTQFQFKIRFFSQGEFPFQNLKFKIKTPETFEIADSRPKISDPEKKEWAISNLSQGENKEIEIFGFFSPQTEIGKQLEFGGEIFLNLRGSEILLKSEKKLALGAEKIFLITQTVNGKTDYLPSPGEKLYYQISFKNLKKEPVSDLTLSVVLEGNIFDLNSIEAPNGQFKPGLNTITWNKEKVFELGYLRPGEEGKVDFWVTLRKDYKPKDPSELNLFIKNRVFLGEFEEIFSYRVLTKVEMIQEAYFVDKYEFFSNSGPVPPKVNQQTTYTVVWKIINYYNPIEKIKVRATLPPEVDVKEVKTPTLGKLSFLGGKTAQTQPVYPGIPPNFKFERNLSFGMSGNDVKYLQIILSKEVPYAFKGKYTGKFDYPTLQGVMEFQQKYKKDILEPQNLTQGTGYVDNLTLLKLNELLLQGGVSVAKEVIWEIDKIDGGTGIFNNPPLATFQISITPTLAQKGKVATLIGEATLVANDQWAGTLVMARDSPIDTTLPDDPAVKSDGKIQ